MSAPSRACSGSGVGASDPTESANSVIGQLYGKRNWVITGVARAQEALGWADVFLLHGFVVLKVRNPKDGEERYIRVDWGADGMGVQDMPNDEMFVAYVPPNAAVACAAAGLLHATDLAHQTWFSWMFSAPLAPTAVATNSAVAAPVVIQAAPAALAANSAVVAVPAVLQAAPVAIAANSAVQVATAPGVIHTMAAPAAVAANYAVAAAPAVIVTTLSCVGLVAAAVVIRGHLAKTFVYKPVVNQRVTTIIDFIESHKNNAYSLASWNCNHYANALVEQAEYVAQDQDGQPHPVALDRAIPTVIKLLDSSARSELVACNRVLLSLIQRLAPQETCSGPHAVLSLACTTSP